MFLGTPNRSMTSSAFGSAASELVVANAIDTVTKTEATKYGFTYKSAITQFTSHGVCGSPSWLNGLNLGTLGDSYHPTATGHSSGYAPLVRSVTG